RVRSMGDRFRYAGGEIEGAMDDAVRALAAGRRSGIPQGLIPPLSIMAWLRVRQGEMKEAESLVDEVMAPLALTPDELNIELAQTLIDLGRHSELERLAKAALGPRWQQLYAAMAA